MRTLTRHIVRPGTEEVRRNRRSRSARLRAAERLAENGGSVSLRQEN
jgi:16S rRNA C1402 N4-methylase RsmH